MKILFTFLIGMISFATMASTPLLEEKQKTEFTDVGSQDVQFVSEVFVVDVMNLDSATVQRKKSSKQVHFITYKDISYSGVLFDLDFRWRLNTTIKNTITENLFNSCENLPLLIPLNLVQLE
jgi:hypothetical protein